MRSSRSRRPPPPPHVPPSRPCARRSTSTPPRRPSTSSCGTRSRAPSRPTCTRSPPLRRRSARQPGRRPGDALEGLVVLYAIESAQPAISRTKLDGLVEHYGLAEGPATEYFSLHARARPRARSAVAPVDRGARLGGRRGPPGRRRRGRAPRQLDAARRRRAPLRALTGRARNFALQRGVAVGCRVDTSPMPRGFPAVGLGQPTRVPDQSGGVRLVRKLFVAAVAAAVAVAGFSVISPYAGTGATVHVVGLHVLEAR